MPSNRTGILKPKTFTIAWEIKGFFANCQKVGNSYESPDFPIAYANEMTKWRLKVYPKGDKEEAKDYVSLYLYFASENEIEVRVDYQFSVASEQNIIFEKKLVNTFKGPLQSWGYRFVKQNAIIDNLIDDSLTISCEVTFHPISQDSCYNKLTDKIENGFGDYEKLLESDTFTDVTFTVQDKQIKSHKAILSCRSSFFKAMFEHDMKENKQSIVNITDIDYEVMKELFRFLYSGRVKDIEKIAKDLLIAADKYCVIELKALCEKALYDQLTVDNAVEYLQLSGTCDTIHLKRLVIKFVADHYKGSH